MKIVIVGSGSIGKRHLRNLKVVSPSSEIVCFRRLNIPVEDFPNISIITKMEELERFRPDVIMVCNPSNLHIDWIEITARLGSHLFMEKPLVTSRKDLENARQYSGYFYNRLFFIGFMMRFHPCILEIKRALEDKVIGAVFHARLEFGGYLPSWPYEDYKSSYAAQKSMGGGVIYTISHEIDLVQFLFGNNMELTSVISKTNLLDITGEEMVELIMDFPDKQVSVHLDYLQRDYHRTIRIVGDKGSLTWDWSTNQLLLKKNKEPVKVIFEIEGFEVNDLYIEELKEFFKRISNQEFEHGLNFEHGISNTEFLLRAHKE